MGTFHVEGKVAAVATPDKFLSVERMLVDTGAEFSWIPEPILQEAGVTVAKKDQRFLTADATLRSSPLRSTSGKTVTRSMGYAFLRSSGFETVDEVVFARPGDLTILGARTLEGFGAVVDAGKKKLAASGPHLAAPGGGDES